MARRKIVVDIESLTRAVSENSSMFKAAVSLGLSYQTFHRRCAENGIKLKKNPGGKGLTAEERYGIEKATELSKQQSERSCNLICTEETREKLRKKALARIDEGKMPSKGLKGYYKKIWFDSSWELAYYLWMVETKGEFPRRNTQIFFDYTDSNGISRRTKPDFILASGELIEIKGYPNVHTKAKFQATKDKVTYLFRKDLNEILTYIRRKYGKDFTLKFYADVVTDAL